MIRFILQNDADEATTTADAENLDYPVSNLKTQLRSSRFRSNSKQAVTICGSWTTAREIDSMVIGRHNFTKYVNWQLILYASEGCTGEILYDSDKHQISSLDVATDLLEWGEFPWGISPWGLNTEQSKSSVTKDTVFWIPETVEYGPPPISGVRSFSLILTENLGASDTVESLANDPYLYANYYFISANDSPTGLIYTNMTQIELNNTLLMSNNTNSLGDIVPYFEIGRLFLGKYIEPTHNISYGHNLSWSENTKQYRPRYGALRSDIVTANKRMEFSLNTITESDRLTLHKQLETKGLKNDFFIAIFPEDTYNEKKIDYRGIVKLVNNPKYNEHKCNYYKSKFIVEES